MSNSTSKKGSYSQLQRDLSSTEFLREHFIFCSIGKDKKKDDEKNDEKGEEAGQ